MTRTFIQDVMEQPQVLEAVASYYGAPAGRDLLESAKQLGAGRDILLTGMGSSYAVSRFAATYLWSFGIKARYAETSELLHYGSAALYENTTIVLISQSGESAEIKQFLSALPKGSPTIGITANLESTLGKNSSVALPIFSGEESTTSSKTYTSSTAVAFLLAQAVAGSDTSDILGSINKAAGDLTNLIKQPSPSLYGQVAGKLLGAKNIHFIGRGPSLATAFQGALMFKELVKIQAECMEAAQFRHGPMETVGAGTVIVVFAPTGRTDSLLLSFAEELRKCGAAVFVVRDGILYEDFTHLANPATAQSTILNEFASTLMDIFPIQVIGNVLAEQLGTAGSFKWITKVTSKE